MAAKKLSSLRGLRIVLFGTPGAGKSSLLGALWQAAQSQEAVLGGKIDDRSGGLAELHDFVYAQKPEKNSDDDLAAYPISLQPGAKGEKLEAVLVDLDGEAAQGCLAQSQNCLDSKNAGTGAILGADAVLLLVDPTAPTEKLFQQFGNFIHTLEKQRSHRNDVVGMPIYLVLTKCDTIAKATEGQGAWMQKIEDVKRKVDKRFQDFLARYPYRTELPFGKVDLHVWATSVKRPTLADRAKAAEPYGVAELFRRCFESAREYHDRRHTARGRLQAAVLGYCALIAAMACAAALFFAIRPSVEITALEGQINEALPSEKKDWFKDIDDKINKLDAVMADRTFAKLSSEQQKRVKDAKEEIQTYKQQHDYLLGVPDIRFAKNEQALTDIENKLDDVKVPEKYADDWAETRLVKKLKQQRQDIKSLREVVKEMETWLAAQVKEGEQLKKRDARLVLEPNAAERTKWSKDADDFLNRRFRDSPSEFIPGSKTINYDKVNRFQNDNLVRLREQLKEARSAVANLKQNAEKRADIGT